jgi:hypothetical protein
MAKSTPWTIEGALINRHVSPYYWTKFNESNYLVVICNIEFLNKRENDSVVT